MTLIWGHDIFGRFHYVGECGEVFCNGELVDEGFIRIQTVFGFGYGIYDWTGDRESAHFHTSDGRAKGIIFGRISLRPRIAVKYCIGFRTSAD